MIHLSHRTWKNYVTNNSLAPNWVRNTQVSACPGLVNYVTEGVVILADEEYEFETSNGKMIPWNYHTERNLHPHFYDQADIVKPMHTICKFDTGLLIKHDEEERLLCVISDYDPMHSDVHAMPGTLPILKVWTPVLINTVYRDGHYLVKKGQPIARIIISFAGKFEFAEAVKTEKGFTDDWQDIKEVAGTGLGSLATFNRELKKCPFHNPS